MTAKIPRKNIAKLQIYHNIRRKTLAQIKAETGADYLLNGGLFNADWSACTHLKADGEILAQDGYTYWGFGWNTPLDLSMRAEYSSCANYIACLALLRNGQPEPVPQSGALSGKRGRSAVALCGDDLLLYCVKDGTQEALTPAALRQVLQDMGASDALMLDGGGSAQCDFLGDTVRSVRVVQNLLLVYLKQPVPTDTPCEVTAKVLNIRKDGSTSSDIVGQYFQGARLVLTAIRGAWGRTARGWVHMDYVKVLPKTEIGQVHITQDLIELGRINRSGRANPMKYITIHNTGNGANGANAAAHSNYLQHTTDKISWHYTVDDREIVQHLPDNECGYHAGDGSGDGNRKSIGIEICINCDGDLQKATDRAAKLVRHLMDKHDIAIGNVVQHYSWSGKNCPQQLRGGKPYSWAVFLEKVLEKGKENKPMTKEEAKAIVKNKTGISDSTLQYLAEDYRWGDDLIVKLAEAMK